MALSLRSPRQRFFPTAIALLIGLCWSSQTWAYNLFAEPSGSFSGIKAVWRVTIDDEVFEFERSLSGFMQGRQIIDSNVLGDIAAGAPVELELRYNLNSLSYEETLLTNDDDIIRFRNGHQDLSGDSGRWREVLRLFHHVPGSNIRRETRAASSSSSLLLMTFETNNDYVPGSGNPASRGHVTAVAQTITPDFQIVAHENAHGRDVQIERAYIYEDSSETINIAFFVPEPSALALVGIASVMGWTRRGRRHP